MKQYLIAFMAVLFLVCNYSPVCKAQEKEETKRTLIVNCGASNRITFVRDKKPNKEVVTSSGVFRVDITDGEIKTKKIFDNLKHFLMVPKGHFLLQNKDGKWFKGNITKPEKLTEVKLSESPHSTRFDVCSLSNNGDKLALSWGKTLKVYDLNTGVTYNAARLSSNSRITYPVQSSRPYVEALMTVQVTGKQTKTKEIAPPSESQITIAGGRYLPPRWSPDGRRIIFEGSIRVKRKKPFDPWICVVDKDSKNLARFCWGDWSNDSKKVFRVRSEKTEEGTLLRSVVFDVAANTLSKQKGSWKGPLSGSLHTPDGKLVVGKGEYCTLKIADTCTGKLSVVPEVKYKWDYGRQLWWLPPTEPAKNQSKKQEPESKPADTSGNDKNSPCRLEIVMDKTQPSEAPVIFTVKVTNLSDKDMMFTKGQKQNWPASCCFRATLTGPDKKARKVAVTNGAIVSGNHGPFELKAGESVITPLRLTNVEFTATGYLPSEQVYLPLGEYKLKVTILAPGTGKPFASVEKQFKVVKDDTLAKSRYEEFKDKRKGHPEQFANHVLEATLTPEVRREWYEKIMGDDLKLASLLVYRLRAIDNPPDDVGPAVLRCLGIHLNSKKPQGNSLEFLLNNAADTVNETRPPGARDILLALAKSDHEHNARTKGIWGLQFYYDDKLTPELVRLLKDKQRWVRIYSAWVLAWAGSDAGAAVMIEASRQHDASGSVFAAGALEYLPDHAGAKQALEEALSTKDARFVERLKKYLVRLPKPRPTKQ